jgi:hypothetical protein
MYPRSKIYDKKDFINGVKKIVPLVPLIRLLGVVNRREIDR